MNSKLEKKTSGTISILDNLPTSESIYKRKDKNYIFDNDIALCVNKKRILNVKISYKPLFIKGERVETVN